MKFDNVTIEFDGAEVPIMDGSSAAFVEAIDKVGICELNAPRWFIKVLRTVRVRNGRSWRKLRPHAGFYLDLAINYDSLAIGHQRRAHEMTPDLLELRANNRSLSARQQHRSSIGTLVSIAAYRQGYRAE